MGKTGAVPSHLHRRIYPHGSPRQDPHFSTPERRTRRGSDPYPPEAHLAGGADRARPPHVARSSPIFGEPDAANSPGKEQGLSPYELLGCRRPPRPAPSSPPPRLAARAREVASACATRPVAAQARSGWSARRRPEGGAEERGEREGAGGSGESVRAGVERHVGRLLDLGTG